MIYAIYSIGKHRFVIDYTFGGVFTGFRVGNYFRVLYDSLDNPGDEDKILINLKDDRR